MHWKMIRQWLFVAAFLVGAGMARAGDTLTVAVAANFMSPFKELATIYQEKTGVEVNGVYTSTGNLYAQIKSGAPYDLFLAADEARPARLLAEGLCNQPFVYAKGRVILWSAQPGVCAAHSWGEAVGMDSVKKIAIANPETAPYGAAAQEALQKAGLLDKAQPRIVVAQNIAQVFQYAQTEAADIGFCALSAMYTEEGKKGCAFKVDEAPPIIQAGCVLKKNCSMERVMDFVDFLHSAEAAAVKKKYGYE